jgi:putative hydrolase of the HAD superfamily
LIQCAAFDLDGVLIPSQPSFQLFEREYGITPAHFREFFRGPYEQAMLGEADLLEALPAALEQWQWRGTAEGFAQTWFGSCSQAEPAAVDIVRLLQAQGVTCWAASNQDNRRAVYLDSLEWLRMLFDRRFYSCELGVKKPSADYFNVIQHEAAVSPSAMLLVDDSQENVDGARRCGWCAEVCRGASDLADIVAAYFPDLAPSRGAASPTS